MTELSRLDRYERRTEWPLAAVAIAFLGLYSVQVLAQPRGLTARAVEIAMWGLYCTFVIDYAARLYLAKPRVKWFFKHVLDLALVVLPFMRPLRLLSLAVVIDVLQRAVGHTIRGKVIAYTVCGAVVLVYAGSLAILQAERDQPSSKITSFGDAVWWAITTVTTVGYGDLSPVTTMGRVVAVAFDDRWHHSGRHRDRDLGLLDRAARRRGGHRQRSGDEGADRGAPRGDPATLELGHP